MKSSNKNIDQKIKSKIENHEFEFSDHAWNKMEGILDPPTTSRRYYFLMSLIFFTMMLFLVLYYMLSGSTANPIPPPQLSQAAESTTTIAVPLDTSITDKAIVNKTIVQDPGDEITMLTPLPQSDFQILKPPFKTIFPPMPKIVNTPSNSTTPTNPEFVENLKNTLAEHEAHFSTEKVYLQFDRSFFEPGEQIWFNAFLRDANSLQPSQKSDMLYVELLGPNGNKIKTHKILAPTGAGKGSFKLDANAVGGRYTVKAYTNWQKNQDLFFEQKIQVQKPVLPKLKMTLDLAREAYGPGDEVSADLELKALDDQPLDQKEFSYVLSLDGKKQKTLKAKTDKNGKAKIRFSLPNNLKTTDGLVNILIEHLGQTESIARSVPIILNKIDLQFLPEGGYLLTNVENGLAFKALNEFGKPADVTGVIVDKKGNEVAEFSTYHQGMGAMAFNPNNTQEYYARILQPEGIKEEYLLPTAVEKGYGLRVMENTGDELTVAINCTEAESMTLVLQSRGEIFGYVSTNPVPGVQEVKLSTKNTKIGIAQLTLFDAQEMPRAERMIFLHPDKKLSVDITADKPMYQPRDAVNLKIAVRDDRGIPLSGKFSLAVADDNLLSFADDKQGNILGSVLLNSELKGTVEEPNFYFDPAADHPEKDQILALDHLMLTQGWRRFDWNEARGQALAAMQFSNEEMVIAGVVNNQFGEPLAGASVELVGTNRSVISDAQGGFRFTDVTPINGRVQIGVAKDGARKNQNIGGFDNNIKVTVFENKPIDIIPSIKSASATKVTGTITEATQGETLIGANVLFTKNGQLVAGTVTDFDGNFELEIEPGAYNIQISYTGYMALDGRLVVKAGNENKINLAMDEGASLSEVVVMAKSKRKRRKKRKKSASSRVKKSQDIKNLPTKNVDAIAATAAGLSQEDEGDNVVVRGSRADAPLILVDGVRVVMDQVLAGNPDMLGEVLEEIPAAKDKLSPEKPVIVDKGTINGRTFKNGREINHQTVTAYRQWGFHLPEEFYAPAYEQKEQAVPSGQRTDFRKTLYWNPEVETGMDGTANVSFYTSDALTSFRATVEGFGQDGGLGRGTKIFSNEIPMGMNVKMLARVLMGDELQIPVIFNNKTSQSVTGKLTIELPEELKLMEGFNDQVKLSPNGGNTIFIPVRALKPHPGAAVKIGFSGGGFKDQMTEKIEILSRGFPVDQGFTSQELSQTFTLNLVAPVKGSINLTLNAQTSLDQQLQADLKRMVRQPRGCFEQTSSSNYPNLLILEYLKSTGNLDPQTKKNLKNHLKSGYNRLTGYEVSGGGFDWFGKPPGHEALTAYGILQFTDMKRVFPVDQKMIDRNAKWLLDRRNGEGGWLLSKRGLHSWKSNDPVYDAYIVWALTEAGMGKQIKKEIEKSAKEALSSKDPYLLALLANTFYKMKDKRAKQFLKLLLQKQEEDGKWSRSANTVVNSRGASKNIETTALAALAIMQDDESHAQLLSAMDFIRNGKSKYGYGSTQATVLAMKAMVVYAQTVDSGQRTGTIKISINGKKVREQKYGEKLGENVKLDNLAQYLKTGKNKVKISFSNTEKAIPYYLGLQYHTLLPVNDEDCALKLSTKLKSKKAKMGDQQRLAVSLKNTTKEAVTNPIIKLGIPAGLSVQAWQLKEMEEQAVFDYYELFDGYLVFYFRELGPSASKEINLDLKADIPGEYSAAASSAWLYYANEAVSWSKAEAIRVER